MTNTLNLAAAGGRKTQSIVDTCADAPPTSRILVLTYTQRNQAELDSRLAAHRPLAAQVDVQGWFGFLLGGLVRPYLPTKFPGRRLTGLNFDGDPGQVAGEFRFLDSEGRAYKRHLSRLACETIAASEGAAIDRISRMYDIVFIDEVQDLNGYDLDVLEQLMASSIEVRMVGDIRQAIINTNVQDPRNKQYKGVEIKKWFDKRAAAGSMTIEHSAATWRCNQEIATFADSVFALHWGFAATESFSEITEGHHGLFIVHEDELPAYLDQYQPLCLRYNAASWTHLTDLPFVNIGVAKGSAADHVVIAPTAKMRSFIKSGAALNSSAACYLYVAVTRGRHSVAFIVDSTVGYSLPRWTPS